MYNFLKADICFTFHLLILVFLLFLFLGRFIPCSFNYGFNRFWFRHWFIFLVLLFLLRRFIRFFNSGISSFSSCIEGGVGLFSLPLFLVFLLFLLCLKSSFFNGLIHDINILAR